MEFLKELVKIADELDRQGHTELADKIDRLVIASKDKKREDELEDGVPVLKLKCRKIEDEEDAYEVVVFAPSGVSPYDPIVHSYVQKYGPYGEGAQLDYLEMLANSKSNEPNTFKYRLRGPAKKAIPGMPDSAAIPIAAAPLASAMVGVMGAEAVESLVKIADELDKAGATDLADKIDRFITGA